MATGVSGVAQKQPIRDDLAAVTEAAKAELDRAIALSGLQRPSPPQDTGVLPFVCPLPIPN